MRVLHSLQSVDHQLLVLLQQSESWLAQRARLLSRTADGHLYVVFGLLLGLSPAGGGAFFHHIALAYALERSLYWVMKNSLRRKRPYDALPGFRSQIIASDEFSFPSGHTSAAFLFVTLVVLHLGPLALPLYLWAASIAMCRVYLGVHFPSDTVMGALLGTAIALSTASWLL